MEATIPEDLSGYRPGHVRLVVSNGLRQSQPSTPDFTPADDVASITSHSLEATCYSIIEIAAETFFGDTPITGLCIWGVEHRRTPFESITVAGDYVTRLSNDWTVASASTTEWDREGRGAGCYLENQPSAGATEFASTELVAWANGFCRIACSATLTVRGPRGVSPAP